MKLEIRLLVDMETEVVLIGNEEDDGKIGWAHCINSHEKQLDFKKCDDLPNTITHLRSFANKIYPDKNYSIILNVDRY